MHTFHHEDYSMNMYPFIIIILMVLVVLFCFFAIIYSIVKCMHKSLRYRYRFVSPPVVVTTTGIPVPPAGYPQHTAGYPQNTVPGVHVSQAHPMYVQQTAYPHSPNATAPYPDAQVPADVNPPSYDQVVRGTDVYQKPLPYNPNFAGQQ